MNVLRHFVLHIFALDFSLCFVPDVARCFVSIDLFLFSNISFSICVSYLLVSPIVFPLFPLAFCSVFSCCLSNAPYFFLYFSPFFSRIMFHMLLHSSSIPYSMLSNRLLFSHKHPSGLLLMQRMEDLIKSLLQRIDLQPRYQQILYLFTTLRSSLS